MTQQSTVHIVSVSGGKDSTATALICLERNDPASVRLVMADTGNEHPLTMQYLDYLRGRLNHPIDVIRSSFVDEIAHKKAYVLDHWPTKGVPDEVCHRAAQVLVPTGNPYLDLCLWKGRFPSRKAQFCTQELKRYPLDRYFIDVLATTDDVESWQGIRRDESQQRKDAAERERTAEGWYVNRPIVTWTAQQTVDFVTSRGVDLNPLYRMGFARVGCAPCINSSKDDVRLWALQFPEVIDRIREWEACVRVATKRGAASYFSAPNDGRGERQGRNIDEVIAWSKTAYGGRQIDALRSLPPPECSSVYGLCE